MNITTTLEQSRKLRKLGYPQHKSYRAHIQKKSGDWYINVSPSIHPKDWVNGTKYIASPNLDELIEWLGDEFVDLTHIFNNELGNWWGASARIFSKDNTFITVQGYTPLECIYNLALAVKGGKGE